MGFLAKLFKKRKETKASTKVTKQQQVTINKQQSLAKQIAEIDSFSQEQLQALLNTTVEFDIQLKVISKLNQPTVLIETINTSSNNKLVLAAQQQLCQLIDNKKVSLNDINSSLNVNQLLTVVANSKDHHSLQNELFDGIKQPSEFLDLAINASLASVRQLAAEQLNDQQLISELLKASKGKDKVVYRIAKNKNDAYKIEAQAKNIQDEKILSLSESIIQLSSRSYDPQFSAKLKLLEAQWLEYKTIADSTLQVNTQQAIEHCQSIIDLEAEVEAKTQARNIAIANLDSDRSTLLKDLESILSGLYVEQTDDLESQLQPLLNQWQALFEFGKTSKVQENRFRKLTQAVQNLQKLLLSIGSLEEFNQQIIALEDDSEERDAKWQLLSDIIAPSQFLTEDLLAESIKEAKVLLTSHENKLKAKADEEQQVIRQINGLIRKGNDAIKQGHLRRAGGISKSLAEKQEQLQEKVEVIPEFIANKLQQYQEDFDKLQDWQSYAVLPKKEKLVETMQSLITTKMDPQSLSELIKELQQEWKSLSKGGQNQHQELWETFHKAAQDAYLPCKTYFDQLAQVRTANLVLRQKLADELTQYAANDDWQGIDWKAVDNLIKVAKNQWRAFSPTERQATRKVQNQFDKAIYAIQGQLQAEYDRNIAQKEGLVKKATALENEEDLRIATDAVKKLQAQWQEVGTTPRSVDQKLWQRFRAACNAVFERRSEQSSAFKAELQEHKQQAEALIAKLTSLCDSELSELLSKRDEVESIKAEFNNLGALPKADIKVLQTAFTKQTTRFIDSVTVQKVTEKNRKWQDFFLLGELISKYEAAMGTSTEDILNELEQKVEKQISALSLWPAGGEAVIRDRLASCKQLSKEQIATNETQLRKLCIRMEIINDKVTPAEDQALRMTYQVERLQQDFGQGAIDEVDGLRLEWVGIGAVEQKVYENLLKRFTDN